MKFVVIVFYTNDTVENGTVYQWYESLSEAINVATKLPGINPVYTRAVVAKVY